MPKRTKKLTLRKRRPSLPKGYVPVDTETYQVEKIIGHGIEENTIHYDVKWLGYSDADNTKEPEYRLNCDDKLLEFTLTVIDPKTYIESIPSTIEAAESLIKNRNNILEIVSPITTIAQTTVQCGSVKFANVDTISSKLKYLKYIISHNQSYVLNSALIPSDDESQKSLENYQKDLDNLLILFPDHPNMRIKVSYPVETVFYSPPPLSNLLFEPVTEEMFEKRKENNYHFIPESDVFGFNKVKPFVHPSYFERLNNDNIKKDEGMERKDFSKDPRFKVSMKLIQRPGSGWVLRSNEDVEENTPLMIMTGVIRPRDTAQKSLEEEGERVAFSSFVEIPGTGMCLDRREFHDFSKYIPHSCKPTCGVRLVSSGNTYPDLVIYSLHAIDSSYSYSITLDYYKMFRKRVRQHFTINRPIQGKIFSLYDQSIDFVHCQCNMQKCPEVLYVSAVEKNTGKPPNKKSKIQRAKNSVSFGGLNLVESDNLYNIVNGKFTE